MSRFLDRIGSQYVYERDQVEYKIDQGLLCTLFRNYGYCVDPGTRTAAPLSAEEVARLRKLAQSQNDQQLVETLASMRPSPALQLSHAELTATITLQEGQRFMSFDRTEQDQIITAVILILEIGLYLGGWRGPEEPYLTRLRPVPDLVRCELRILPKLEALHLNPAYVGIKNFPMVSYGRSSISMLPVIRDPNLTLDHILDQVSIGVDSDSSDLIASDLIASDLIASDLIITAYYYLTTIGSRSYPMIEPLVQTLVP